MWKNTRKEEMQGSYLGLWCRRVSCQSCFKGILSGASYGIAVEEQRKEWLCSFWWLSHFPIFIWYKSQVSKMVLPIFRINLIFPVKPLCEHPHKHAYSLDPSLGDSKCSYVDHVILAITGPPLVNLTPKCLKLSHFQVAMQNAKCIPISHFPRILTVLASIIQN